MAVGELGEMVGAKKMDVIEGTWRFDEDDFLLMAMLCDPIYMSELLFEDPLNHEHGGCYTVRDYQYPLFRPPDCYAAFPCGRSTGKTESIKARAVSHAFKRRGEDMLLTAPELIHLEALTQHVEQRLTSTRLTHDFLKRDYQKTGFTHKPFQVDFMDGTRIMGRIPRLTGPQPLDARILTQQGWTTMGEVVAGDGVFDARGRVTRVLGVTNSWESPVFRVEFSDGTYTHADRSHRWRVCTDSQGWRIVNTQEIAEALAGPAKQNGGRLNMFRVPPNPLIHYAGNQKLPLDPYIVGALLGDGMISQKQAGLCTADAEIVSAVSGRLPAGHQIKPTGKRGLHYRITGPSRHEPNEVIRALKGLCLLGTTSKTKFIPEVYKTASPQDRIELLRGLFDTDGTAKSGGVHLVSASRRLVEDAAEICRSLGGWASSGQESSQQAGTYWRTTQRLRGINLFALKRKAARYSVSTKQRHRSIRRVEPSHRELVRCIKVDSQDESYLTDSMIPTLNTGVKGMHEPDLIVDEAQDYPPKGYTEVHETVEKDHKDSTGKLDFTYHLYGVHSGAAGGRFEDMANSGQFKVHSITAIMRPGWGKAEKEAASAMYGGTHSPDYRRNILGEPGTALSAFFVIARLMACLDQDSESAYNTVVFKDQHLTAEDVDKLVGAKGDTAGLLDLAPATGKHIWGGMDVGLVNDPTVIMLFELDKERLKLIRMIHLHRFRERQIRECVYRIDRHYGKTLQAFGTDITGLGLPLLQSMEDDEQCSDHLREVLRGYVFNAKVPVAVDEDYVQTIGDKMVDQYGNTVKVERNNWTGKDRYLSMQTMIEASTRYLRNMVDKTFLQLPFHQALVKDMQGETEQRVRAMGVMKKKPNAFHMLDAMRAMAMAYYAKHVEEDVMQQDNKPVMDIAVDLQPGIGGGMDVSLGGIG